MIDWKAASETAERDKNVSHLAAAHLELLRLAEEYYTTRSAYSDKALRKAIEESKS